METSPEKLLESLSEIISNINSIFYYDSQLIFSDSFDRIKQQLNNIEKIISLATSDQRNYWVIYNIVIAVIPISEQIIFAGYSDQILEFLISINNTISSILIFCTSRYIPFRLQVFLTVCSAFANTEDSREKDADAFIKTYKNELIQLKQLEDLNINGLDEQITLCNKKKCQLSTIFNTALTSVDLMSVHFNTSEEIVFEKIGSSRKPAKKPKARPVKEEQTPQVFPVPPPHTINLVCNAFNSPLSKSDYLSKYGQVTQAWTNPECQLAPSFLHRLIYSFLKIGNSLENVESLVEVLPDDKIVQLAAAISAEKWIEVSEIIFQLTKEDIKIDFQFYDEVALKIWKRFCEGKIDDPLVLKGVLHVLVLSPSPCPMQISMVALHYCWYLNSQKLYLEATEASESALNILDNFRDIFTIRTFNRPLPSTTKIPNKPLNQGYMQFEKWIECLHADLLTVWIKSKLNHGLQIEIEKAKEQFAREIENTKIECQKTKQLYGTLSIKQKEKFDSLINRQFKPPIHSPDTEKQLIEYFKSNNAALALLYVQMAFFRPQKADFLLEKASKCISELKSQEIPLKSPILYVNRTEVGLFYPYSTPEAKSVAAFGKETVGSTGLTLSNNSLNGTGIKQDLIEPFIITKLKPNTLYTFGFGAFDSYNELVDNITESFNLTTCHKLSLELIYGYLASASYQLKNMSTFDISLEYLLNRFTNVTVVKNDHSYYEHLNPFNKFLIKKETFSEPAPMLRSFSTALMMAARLFANKPLHATSFQKVALILSQVLNNFELTLQICSEIFALLQPLLTNAYHSRWVIHPLLYIINTLKNNKQTAKSELHQQLASKCSFVFDSILVQLYQERQLSSYALNSVVELQSNPYRTSFMLFASKNQLLEANVNDSTLPLVAAEMFRTSPERSYDDLFSKFKTDPQFPLAAVYLVSAALNAGYCTQAVSWCNSALDYIKSTLHEPDEKAQQKKQNVRSNSKIQQRKRVTTAKGKKNEPQKAPEDDAAENSAATKIQTVWNRFHHRRANLAKFDAVNKYRAALNLLLAICMIESDQQMSDSTTQETSRTGRKDKQHLTKGRQSKHSTTRKPGPTEEDQATNDQSLNVINALIRAIVFGNRSNESIVIQSASTFFRVYLDSIQTGTASFNSLAPLTTSITQVAIRNLPLNERFSQELLKNLLLIMSNDGQVQNITINLIDACKISQVSGMHLWIMPNSNELPAELVEVSNSLKQRDPSENQFYEADAIYQRAIRPEIFTDEQANRSDETFSKMVNDLAIALQHKQKLSMSICLQSKMAFTFFDRNNNQLAINRLFDALECHFRLVKAQDKVDQILKGETEESFYSKHSWAGCISIFVISSLISISSDRVRAMQLSRLAAFSLASLFTASPFNPKKQIDYADYEPAEIIPGVDVFSDFDPQNPLLEAPPAQYLSLAISHLLSSMLSFEMYFEMFKPLSFARHFFRFIARDKRHLARCRLTTIIVCTKFGILQPAMKLLNDVLTNFGEPRVSKETALYPANSKRLPFDIHEAPSSSINMEAVKTISSTSLLTQVTNLYGSSITCQYAICVSKILQNIAECSDPSGSINDVSLRQGSQTARGKHKRQHHGKKEPETTSSQTASQSIDTFESTLNLAENLINDVLSKEFKPNQENIKHEVEIEKAQIHMKQWRWEDAIQIAQTVLKSNPKSPPMLSAYIDRPILLTGGLVSSSAQIIATASYHLHDYQNTEKVATPYLKALLFIHKAEYENAAQLLSKIYLHPPITAFHREYILSVAQLVELFCYNHKLYEPFQSNFPSPVDLIAKINNDTYSFFTEQLQMNEGRSYFIRDTHLLVRLKHLEALTIVHFNGNSDPIEILSEAQHLMDEKCPFNAHGLSFLLNASSCRIQMQSILSNNPLLIQNWNQRQQQQEEEAATLIGKPTINLTSPEQIDKLTSLLQAMFNSAPDCVVHPASQQCILDYAVLAGVSLSNEANKKLEQSISALLIASVVRSSRRYIQSLIAQSSNSSQSQACPTLLMNENKDQSLRNIAASYYAHVCSLELPVFDSEVLEMRTLLYFKCFEELCQPFKTIQRAAEQVPLETGHIVGQWFQVDSKLFKGTSAIENGGGKSTCLPSLADRSTVRSRLKTPSNSGTRSNLSVVSSRAGTSYTNRRKGTSNQGQVKGSLLFFIGIIVDIDDCASKRKTSRGGKEVKEKDGKESSLSVSATAAAIINEAMGRLIPLTIIAQNNDLKSTSNEMAEIGLNLDEAARLESAEAQGEAPPQREEKDTNDSKKKKSRSSKLKSLSSPEVAQNISLLKNQANIAFKNAEIKWNVTVHKAEAILKKSNRIAAILNDQKNFWPPEYKMDGVDISNATMLSHFFNTQYGVNEKAPQFADWLCQNFLNVPVHTSTSNTTPRLQLNIK